MLEKYICEFFFDDKSGSSILCLAFPLKKGNGEPINFLDGRKTILVLKKATYCPAHMGKKIVDVTGNKETAG